MTNQKILVTTPDYPPKLGGLSTFSKNLVNLLKDNGHEVKVLCWSSISEATNTYNQNKDFDLYFHVHYMGGFLGGFPTNKSINFCHGSELFFTSPNFLKRLIKKMSKTKSLQYFEESLQNIFISRYTRGILQNNGFKVNYARDLVFHNCIPLPEEVPVQKKFYREEKIKLCSIARDVPHKNLDGVFSFAELLAKVSKQKIELSMTSNRFQSSEDIIFKDISNITNSELIKVYNDSHYNVLLSKNNSSKGFVEGFGLTTLEAAKYGTPSIVTNSGGLKENIHHEYNGYRFDEVTEATVEEFFKKSLDLYPSWSQNCFEHLVSSHSMEVFQKLLSKLIGSHSE
ncbi:MAG: glycosyltransferase involved in cell wall biosynthesis [Bacteriovoracaceae bacterium]|jgi:glycosyltransferase involved in cell wall biosynthesis